MQFDHFTITLLVLRPDAPEMDDATAGALQSEHLAHLADLHDQGILLAAGPLGGPADREYRGLSIWHGEPEDVLRIVSENPDPSVAAGRLMQLVIPWKVPSGALAFSQARFPRSIDEAVED